jgi:YbbR domain-containing protein
MQQRSLYIVIFSTLFGVLAWVSVTMREDYETTVTVPFVLQEIPPGMAVQTPLPHALQLRFRGEGWRLAGVLLGRAPVIALSAASLPAGRRPLTFKDFADHISLAPGVRLLDVKPDSLRIELGTAVRKRVPVVLDCLASFREGYGQVGPTSVAPDSVTLTGAETVLRGLDSWKTERRVFENIRGSLDAEVPLASADPFEIAFSVPAVRIAISVEPFAEKIIPGLPVQVSAVPANREVILIPPRIEIVVRAGIRQLSALSAADFRVETSYAEIAADSTGAIDADVACPAGVQLVTKRPDHLQYIVRKRL